MNQHYTEQPLQKLRARLGACKIGLSPPPPSVLYSLVTLSFKCDTSFVVLIVLFFGSDFVLFEPYVHFHIFNSVRVTEWPPIGEWLLTRLTMCFLGIST